MNKKGSHVDWAISMGIFLVYLVGLFILIRPGVTPVYKPEGLLEILEDKFMKNVTYEVREIPLIIELCKGKFEGSDIDCVKNAIIVKDLKENFNFKNPEDEKGEDVTELCDCDPNKDIEDTTYYYTYYQSKPDKKETDLKAECSPHDDEDHCKITLGASTTKTGINDGWKNKLDPTLNLDVKYEDLKKNWNLENIDFAIYYKEGISEPKKLIGGEKPQGVNIFTKEIKTNILRQEGDLEPVTISLQVW